MQDRTFIGLDVHKTTVSVAVAGGERGGEVRHWGMVPHRPDLVRKLVEKLVGGGGRLHFCYEAGPCGYGLYRQFFEMGHDCIVGAPSLIPVKAGDRVKTDRRTMMLAKLHRTEELTAVYRRCRKGADAVHEEPRPDPDCGDVATAVMAAILAHREVAPLLSEDPFWVDGTMVKVWASRKSFQPKAEIAPPDEGRPGDRPGLDTTARKQPEATQTETAPMPHS